MARKITAMNKKSYFNFPLTPEVIQKLQEYFQVNYFQLLQEKHLQNLY